MRRESHVQFLEKGAKNDTHCGLPSAVYLQALECLLVDFAQEKALSERLQVLRRPSVEACSAITASMPLVALLFPAEPRRLPWGRPVQVGLRTVHIVAMGMVLGGLAMGGTHDTLLGWIVATVASGVLLLGVDLWKSCAFLLQGAGAAVLLKLGLLGLGNLFPAARLEWYLAATAVASVGSHMSSGWRHASVFGKEVGGG